MGCVRMAIGHRRAVRGSHKLAGLRSGAVLAMPSGAGGADRTGRLGGTPKPTENVVARPFGNVTPSQRVCTR